MYVYLIFQLSQQAEVLKKMRAEENEKEEKLKKVKQLIVMSDVLLEMYCT